MAKTDNYDFSVGREAIKGLPGRVLMNVLQFTIIAIIARFLGASGLGTYTFFFTVVKSSEIIINGFGEALKKRISEEGSKQRELFGAALLFHLFFVIITGTIGAIIIFLFNDIIPMGTNGALFALFAFQSHALFILSQEIYSALGNPGESLWFESLARSLILACQTVFLWYGYGIEALMLGIFLGTITTAFGGFYIIKMWPKKPSKNVIISLYHFAKYSIPTEMLGSAYSYSDTFAIFILIGSTELGQFSAAGQLILAGTVVGTALAQPLIVKSSNKHSRGESVNKPLAVSISYAGIIGIPLIFLTLAVPEAMPIIYGSGFTGTGLILFLVAGYSVTAVYKLQFIAIFNGIDKPDVPFKIRVIQGIVYIPIIVFVALEYGFIGLLIASWGVELFGLTLSYTVARYEFTGSIIFHRVIFAQFIGGIVAYITADYVFSLLSTDIYGLILTLIPAFLFYAVTVLALSPITRTSTKNYVVDVVYESN